MKVKAVIVALISLVLTACNQNKPTSQIPEVDATVDSAAIAQDTFQQKSLEESYEYAQTVVVNPKLVYDVRAYDGPPSHGEYCILRRGADNNPDTVVHGERNGIIVNAFAADLNNNGREEIYIVMRKPGEGFSDYVSAFEFDENGHPVVLDFGSPGQKTSINFPINYVLNKSPNSDTIYAFNGLLFKKYKYYLDQASNKSPYAWKLVGAKFKLIP